MVKSETLTRLEEKMAPLRENLLEEVPEETLSELSQWLRSFLIKQPVAKKKDPKQLGQEMQVIDLFAHPVLAAAGLVLRENPSLVKKIEKGKQAPHQIFTNLIESSLEILVQGEELNIGRIQEIMEQIASE